MCQGHSEVANEHDSPHARSHCVPRHSLPRNRNRNRKCRCPPGIFWALVFPTRPLNIKHHHHLQTKTRQTRAEITRRRSSASLTCSVRRCTLCFGSGSRLLPRAWQRAPCPALAPQAASPWTCVARTHVHRRLALPHTRQPSHMRTPNIQATWRAPFRGEETALRTYRVLKKGEGSTLNRRQGMVAPLLARMEQCCLRTGPRYPATTTAVTLPRRLVRPGRPLWLWAVSYCAGSRCCAHLDRELMAVFSSCGNVRRVRSVC